MKKKENLNATIGINDEWLENIFDRKLILPNDKKDSEKSGKNKKADSCVKRNMCGNSL